MINKGPDQPALLHRLARALLFAYRRNGYTSLPATGKILFLIIHLRSATQQMDRLHSKNPGFVNGLIREGATGCDGTLTCVRNVILDALEDTGA